MKIVFDSLLCECVPLEEVTYHSDKNQVEFKFDDEDDNRRLILLFGIESYSFKPCEQYDMDMFCVDDMFTVNLYKRVEGDLKVYYFPTQDGIWEFNSSSSKSPELM